MHKLKLSPLLAKAKGLSILLIGWKNYGTQK